MGKNYVVAGYLNQATQPAKPMVELQEGDASPGDVREMLAGMHSKGTTYSCAV